MNGDEIIWRKTYVWDGQKFIMDIHVKLCMQNYTKTHYYFVNEFSMEQVFAKLEDLADKIRCTGLESPTLIIIGKVVALSPLWMQSCGKSAEFVEAK